MKKRIFALFLSALLLATVLCACGDGKPEEDASGFGSDGTSSSGEAVTGGELVVGISQDLGDSLDPYQMAAAGTREVLFNVFEGLIKADYTGDYVPAVASDYTVSEDGLTYTFPLREGVLFHNGDAVTPEDVVYSFETCAATSNETDLIAALSVIQNIAVEGNSVVITLSEADTNFISYAAMVHIVPDDYTEQATAPVGTGPYLLSQTESDAWLVANQTWWRGSSQPTDRIALVEAADQDTMLYRFTSRDVQLITTDLTGTSPISVTGNVSYQDTDTTIFQYIGCNVARQPLDDPAFRRALSIAVNRSRIVSAFLSGHGDAAQFPVSPSSPLYPAELERSYSRDDLTAALGLSSYTSSRTLTLLVNEENSFKTSVANFLAESFTSAGIAVSVKVLPWEEYTAALAAGNFDLYYGEVRLSADWDLSALLSTGGALNYGGWSNETTDRLLTAFASAGDRIAAMTALCRHLQEQAPILPVCFKSTSVLTQTGVLENLVSTAAEPFYGLTDCTVHLRKK